MSGGLLLVGFVFVLVGFVLAIMGNRPEHRLVAFVCFLAAIGLFVLATRGFQVN